jgi:bifunctional protein TilS/HprT
LDNEGLPPSETTHFAHNSELQFAKLLDFYGIEWEYEPRSFDIGWDSDGQPNQRFTPDFYLPQYDTFIEITTLNQKLVTKKNRKVRLLRQHYPDVKCKIFYQRDYIDLLIKYGLEHPSQSLAAKVARTDSVPEQAAGAEETADESAEHFLRSAAEAGGA